MTRTRDSQRSGGAMLEGVEYDSDSPLDDGFREEYEVERTHENNMSLLDAYDDAYFPEDGTDSGHDSSLQSEEDITLPAKDEGWTGPVNAVPGPSRISPKRADADHEEKISHSFGTDTRRRTAQQREDAVDTAADAFAERFKYLVCSSGILEKDYVPGLGGGTTGENDVHEEGDALDGAGTISLPGGLVTSAKNLEQEARRDANELWALARNHWNISIAIAALALGLRILVGPRMLMLVIAALLVAAAMWPWQWQTKIDQTSPDKAANQPLTESLTTFLDTSRGIDTTIDSALRVLQPHSSTTATLQPLRLTLYRVLDDMADAIAAATSTLLGLVDKDELAVLGQMYDITAGGSFIYNRHTNYPGEGEVALPQSSVASLGDELAAAQGRIPSPRRPYATGRFKASAMLPAPPMSAGSDGHQARPSASTSTDDRFTSLPRRTPRLSKRTSYDREIWAIVRDQAVSRPKHERRITEASEESDDGLNVQTVDILPRTGEEDNEVSASLERSLPILSPKPSLAPAFPISPPSAPVVPTSVKQKRRSVVSNVSLSPHTQPHTPRRASPLSRPDHSDSLSPPHLSDSDHAPASASSAPPSAYRLADIGRPDGILPSPQPLLAKTAKSAKRLSLQNMPYYRSIETDLASGSKTATAIVFPAGESLERTRSLPHSASDLQELRSRHATGSRRSSVHSASSAILRSPLRPLPYGSDLLPFPQDVYMSPSSGRPLMLTPSGPYRSTRVPSVSPLTLPALKASCLGVHTKRRRLACCLLGLNFANLALEEYAQDVRDVLGDLSTAFLAAKEKLVAALEDVKPPSLPPMPLVSPFGKFGRLSGVKMPSSGEDFAPRSSDAAILLERISEMQKVVHLAWTDLATIQTTLMDDSSPSTSLENEWRNVREHLGGLVREWERGKEAVARLASHPQDEGLEADETTENQPAFLKTWEEADASGPSVLDADTEASSLDSNRPLSLESLPGPAAVPLLPPETGEELPPIGIEEVFEGTPSKFDPVKTKPGSMARDERIALMKAAREKGMTLNDMLSGAEAAAGANDERKRLEGEVVRELGGLMGMIRQRKSGKVAEVLSDVSAAGGNLKQGEPTEPAPEVLSERAGPVQRPDQGSAAVTPSTGGQRDGAADLFAELRGTTFRPPVGLGIVGGEASDGE